MELRHDTSRGDVQDMLDNFYSDERGKAEAALKAVQDRQDALENAGFTQPVRKWWYNVTGRQERDHALAEDSRAQLQEINDKKTLHLSQLDKQQQEQKQDIEAQFNRRQAAQSAAIDRKREERADRWWKALPEREDRDSGASGQWWRAQQEPEKSQDAAPEPQQNQDKDRGHEPER